MKNFDEWNELKKKIESKEKQIPIFREREVWWCSIGLNIGSENDGKHIFFERPVLILKKFNRQLAWAIPTTSKIKLDHYHHQLNYHGKTISVILSQLRLISAKRLRWRITTIPSKTFDEIKNCIIELIEEELSH